MVNVFLQQTWKECMLILKAPSLVPEMWWIITPLFVTFLVMTFYFGVYKREELGWNTALGNTVVLMFVAIDLLRTVYHYTIPPMLENFAGHPVIFLIIAVIIVEAFLLFYFAFAHALPKKLMFFLASPLPVNLQAYVITSIVYLRLRPSWYMLSAAVLLFFVLFVVTKGLQLLLRITIEKGHKKKLELAKGLREAAHSLRSKARKLKGSAAQEVREEAEKKLQEAKELEQEVVAAEILEHGKLKAAKGVSRRKEQ